MQYPLHPGFHGQHQGSVCAHLFRAEPPSRGAARTLGRGHSQAVAGAPALAAVLLQGTMSAMVWPEAGGALLRAGQEGQRPQDGWETWTHCLPRGHMASTSCLHACSGGQPQRSPTCRPGPVLGRRVGKCREHPAGDTAVRGGAHRAGAAWGGPRTAGGSETPASRSMPS